MDVLKLYYKMEEDWKGQLYFGITLNRNYDKGYVDISMPTYVAKKLTEYGYKPCKSQQYSHMNQIQSDMERIQTTLFMKRSPHLSMTRTKHSFRKY